MNPKYVVYITFYMGLHPSNLARQNMSKAQKKRFKGSNKLNPVPPKEGPQTYTRPTNNAYNDTGNIPNES